MFIYRKLTVLPVILDINQLRRSGVSSDNHVGAQIRNFKLIRAGRGKVSRNFCHEEHAYVEAKTESTKISSNKAQILEKSI